MSFAALVLAGERPGGDPLARAQGVAHKALIELAGEPMLARVCAALREAGADSVHVSCARGPVDRLAHALGCATHASASGPAGSVLRAFEAIGAPLVVTTADHALLRAAWVRELIAGTPADRDLALMLARRGAIERALPGSRRTWLRFADGQWSGCNLFFLKTPAAANAILAWQAIEADRKRPWRIVARLGPRTLFDYALGRLTLAEGLSRLGARLGVRVALVPARDGLAAVDADSERDLIDIRAVLDRKER